MYLWNAAGRMIPQSRKAHVAIRLKDTFAVARESDLEGRERNVASGLELLGTTVNSAEGTCLSSESRNVG